MHQILHYILSLHNEIWYYISYNSFISVMYLIVRIQSACTGEKLLTVKVLKGLQEYLVLFSPWIQDKKYSGEIFLFLHKRIHCHCRYFKELPHMTGSS